MNDSRTIAAPADAGPVGAIEGIDMLINYANGQRREVETVDEATAILRRQYGDEVVVHDEWEASGSDSERRLVWACEADADNDAGAAAVAEIIRPVE